MEVKELVTTVTPVLVQCLTQDFLKLQCVPVCVIVREREHHREKDVEYIL